jgi:hypothetical protein
MLLARQPSIEKVKRDSKTGRLHDHRQMRVELENFPLPQ